MLMINWSELKVGDFVKAPGSMNYYVIVESEELGEGFPNKFYALQVFTGEQGVVCHNWKKVSKLNPIILILYLGCFFLQVTRK